MTERYLIINADDYGMCHAANEAVEDLFNNGLITSATLMTPCPWAEDALRRAERNERMHVGLHLTLNAEYQTYRWGPVSRKPVPSLLDEWGYLFQSVPPLLAEAEPEDIRTEIAAQLDWMLARGYRPTHMDNHMGSLYGLMGPGFLPDVFALCAKHGLPFRMPRSPVTFGRLPPDIQAILARACAEADRLGVGILDSLLDFGRPLTPSDTYETVKARYIEVIRGIGPGINELFLHPALDTAELRAICPAWQMRVWEHRVMLDDEVGRVIEKEGIKLTTWTEAPFGKRALEGSHV